MKHKLAHLLCMETGAYFEPRNLTQNDSTSIQRGSCSWDAFGVAPGKDGVPARRVHVYSWDTMTECARYGITKSIHPNDRNDYEISSKKE